MTDYTRQKDWYDPDKVSAACTIVGCGGIGSFTALALAKLGVQRLNLVDFDTVDEHNIPNQLYGVDWVDSPKVEALEATLSAYAGLDDVLTFERPLQDGIPRAPVVISALDSMTARAALWEQVRYKLDVKLFLDGRLAGENIILYAVDPTNPTDVKGYEDTLHSDEEGSDLPCTGRSIIDVGFAIGSLMTRAVRRHYAGEAREAGVYLDQANLDIYKFGWEDA
jgi:sulfur carrier protein ThiS adenylyltransferase